MTMLTLEKRITDLLRSRIQGVQPSGLIKCEAQDGGSCGYTGEVEAGWPQRKKRDLLTVLGKDSEIESRFLKLIVELREASRSNPPGPWYRCNIVIGPEGIEFKYFWEKEPHTSVKELEPTLTGGVPNYVLSQRFDKSLIDALRDRDVNDCLWFYVPARLKENKPLTEPVLEIYATLDWQWEVSHVGMNGYFADDDEPVTGMPRSEVYPRTLRGLRRIGHDAAAELFSESLALFAHFYPRVEEARRELRISPVPRQQESDIMERYGKLESSLDPARTAYIRSHITELQQQD